MTPASHVSVITIIATLAISLVLVLVPLPAPLAMARPALYTLTVLFWVAYQPQRVGLIAAWVAGLAVDVIDGTPLAEHALAMAIAAYVLIKLRGWLWNLPGIQQGIIIAPVLVAYEFTLFWIDGVAGLDVAPTWRWLPAVSSTLVWPIWAYLLERVADFEVV